MPRIFFEWPYFPGEPITLPKSQSHHIARVLRMRVGETVLLFDGGGHVCRARIEQLGKSVHVMVEALLEVDVESPLQIHLGQVMSRGEKMDWTIQKAVELGVSSITPLLSARCGVKLSSERLEKRVQHWQNIIISSCEQCGRNVFPTLNVALSLDDWLNSQEKHHTKLILHPTGGRTLQDELPQALSEISLCVGSEGGFSEDEIQDAESHGFVPVKLGPRILRTETAAVVLLSVLQFHAGDF